jgi:amino acid adenylation domain-containing protein
MEHIAIIGLAGRFPGASGVEEFWENLRNGVESISHFSDAELEVRDAARVTADPGYVKAHSVLEGVDLFDAEFFGIYPQEAKLMDPQHRVFLESCWEAMEDAGYDASRDPSTTGVFAGCSPNSYFLRQVASGSQYLEDYTGAYQVGFYPTMLGTIADTLATRVAYKLNLRGPAMTLVTACSTSLVAISQACKSLLTYECDQALAGGVSITFPQKRGYQYQSGGMVSPDGHCRPFDADAQGTVFGSGAGVVLLKRLEEAVSDGDHIYAVIRGSAINNDGAAKVGFTAPSVDGQSRVIAMAQAAAEVDPRTISYIEAHGTGTPLGDPIEVAALTRVFRASTDAKGICAIGTAKANVGHLDVASGVTGLIKTVMALKHRQIPPQIHFRSANPKLDLESSPFYVNTSLKEWVSADDGPLRAGVSAFGVGGTNAHVVLEEAPAMPATTPAEAPQVLTLSARTATALDAMTARLAKYLERHPELDLADVAYTLQVGRTQFSHRRTIVGQDSAEVSQALLRMDPQRVSTRINKRENASVQFLFPGQGAQQIGMARGLYESEPVFRSHLDHCAELLKPLINIDVRTVLYPASEDAAARETLQSTSLAQPAIFAVEYALARLWIAWGIEPQAMVGHSVGEFVAACLADVFSLEDALSLVAARGLAMQSVAPGAMLSVRMPEAEIRKLLNGKLSLAAINSPHLAVVAGPFEAITALEKDLEQLSIVSRRLSTSHAFHSWMMDDVVGPFTEQVRRVRLKSPRIPYVSTVTGTWISADQATDPEYWGSHLRQPVLFSKAICELAQTPGRVFLEVGPGATLSTLVRQILPPSADFSVVSSLPPGASPSDAASLQAALGALWLAGVQPRWADVHRPGIRRRVSLPTYPFEKSRFWMESTKETEIPSDPEVPALAGHKGPLHQVSGEFKIEHQILPSAGIGASIMDRNQRIRQALSQILEELSGMDVSQIEANTTFLDMGFDSLFLTQVTQAIQGKFGLKVTFRQLLDQQSTLEALASFIDERLPADAFPDETRPTAPLISGAQATAPANAGSSGFHASSAPVDGTVAERIVAEQLRVMTQLMAQQLEVLGGRKAVPATPDVFAPAPQIAASPAVEPSPAAQEFKPFGPYKPVQKTPAAGLTPQQERHIDKLIASYTRRTAGSKKMTQDYRTVLADPRVVSGFRAQWKEMVYPLVTVKSQGSRLWDVDGNEYIDLLNGFGPTVFGHLPDFVTEAVRHQLEQGVEIGPQSPLAGPVAKLICELTGMERATFCNTGSEAVMAAIRVARTVTARKKIVSFKGSYHGTFDEVLAKGVQTKAGLPRSTPIAPGIPQEKVDNIVVLDYGAPESLAYIKAHATELAAVLVEPVQSRHPSLQPREFCQELREITKASGTALIFDEVVTGFRSHPGGVQALWGIRADLATYGKVLGGGLPIGVLAGSAEYMDALDGGAWNFGDDSSPEKGVTFFAGTFVRHPLALAACHSVLKHLQEQGPALQERLNARTAQMVAELNQLFEQNQVHTRIETFSSVFYFAFHDQPSASLFYYHLREKGVHIQEGFPCFLTTAHSEADIVQILGSFKESVREMQNGGFWPSPHSITPTATTAISTAHLNGHAPSEASSIPAESPLTESQLEVLLAAQMSSEASCSFNESFSLRFHGDLNEAALRDALQDLLDRHQGLRAQFNAHGEFQRFKPHLPLDLPVVDLAGLDAPRRNEQLNQMIADDARLPFSLVEGPLVRMKLVRLAPREHVLLFSSHHIVCDGWSTNIILDELSKLYTSRHQGQRAQLPTPMSFEAYARSQKKYFENGEAQKVEDYWTAQFKDLPPLLDLPLDRPRPTSKSYEGATYRCRIPAETYRGIKKAGAQQKCTLFVTLLAGFQALLSRLSGQDDIVVGVPAAGQSLIEEEILVGHCVNFLPLRARFTSDPLLSDYLTQIKRTVLDAYDHQNYTYGRLVRKLTIPRDPSRLPLTEVQFNLERVGEDMEFSGLTVEVDPNPKAFVNHDLFLNIVESASGLTLDCDYNTVLFDETTIRRWMGHYTTLLENLANHLGQPVSRLPLLSESERHQMAVEWNDTRAKYPDTQCVHELFHQQALRTPEAVAAVYEGQQLTYAELDRKANQLARYLGKQGVKPGSLVGVFVDRSAEMIVALLGVLKSGAAYVPMDPTYPNERIAFVLEDANVPALLTQEKLTPNLAGSRVRTICLDTEWGLIGQESGQAPAHAAAPEDLAYVIYTSGSTGRPKGVEISHRALVNLLNSMQKKPGLEPRDTLLAVTTLSFDIAGLELFLPLITGAKLVIASREAAADGSLLLALLKSSGAKVMQATPVTWKLLLEAGWDGRPALKVLCGGEAFPRELANELNRRASSVWNMYGPTETTIWSATSQIQPGDGPVLIGGPIDNTQFYVLEKSGALAPIGVAGELYIAGDGLARGYFRRPELTTANFVANLFAGDSGKRMYKTGDLVRRLPNGAIEFLGRLDTQVKLRGFRIELGEIESALVRYPGVREAVVIVREDIPGDKRLVAYVTSDHKALTITAVREFLTGKLPNYMLPSALVTMDTMPLTPNRKIDRKALPPPDGGRPSREREFVAPRNEQERLLAEIWEQVLHLERVGIDDNLFELGADSLHIFQIAARAGKAGITIAPAAFLKHRTIASLMAHQQAEFAHPPAQPVAPILPVSREKYRLKSLPS